jgi:hypothetical protein
MSGSESRTSLKNAGGKAPISGYVPSAADPTKLAGKPPINPVKSPTAEWGKDYKSPFSKDAIGVPEQNREKFQIEKTTLPEYEVN